MFKAMKSIGSLIGKRASKGDAGRILVVGGSFEYTGAPYFAAKAALRSGADLAFVACSKEAAIPIKSYSPDIIVYPLLPLNLDKNQKELDEYLESYIRKIDIAIIGPGLSRDPSLQSSAIKLSDFLLRRNIPCIFDGDAIFMVSHNLNLISDKPEGLVILTPNSREFEMFCKSLDIDPKADDVDRLISKKFSHLMVIKKGPNDKITLGDQQLVVDSVGSPRRCGGQGDILTGILATYLHTAKQNKLSDIEAAYQACLLQRSIARNVYQSKGTSGLASDMLDDALFNHEK